MSLVPTNKISVFSLFTLRKLHVNHDLISDKRAKREEGVELGFEDKFSEPFGELSNEPSGFRAHELQMISTEP